MRCFRRRLTVRPLRVGCRRTSSSRVFLICRATSSIRLIPRDVFPVIRPRPAHLRLQHAPVVQDVVIKRRSLGTQRAAIDGMVRIAFHVDHLRGHVLGLVAERVNDHAATDRAVRAQGPRLRGARDLQLARLRVRFSDIESEHRGDHATCAHLKEPATGWFHWLCWDYTRAKTSSTSGLLVTNPLQSQIGPMLDQEHPEQRPVVTDMYHCRRGGRPGLVTRHSEHDPREPHDHNALPHRPIGDYV